MVANILGISILILPLYTCVQNYGSLRKNIFRSNVVCMSYFTAKNSRRTREISNRGYLSIKTNIEPERCIHADENVQ